MSNSESPINIVRLMTTFNFEILSLPDDLKCLECKSILKDACQVSCGCRFCHTCLDYVMARGDEFCTGDSQECRVTSLSTAVPDDGAEKSILELIAKCQHTGCSHECQLADMEDHLRLCSRQNLDCPFRELKSVQGLSCAEDTSGQLESMGMDTNFTRNMEMLKRKLVLDEEQTKNLQNENKLIKIEIEAVNSENKSINYEMKLIKDENESIKMEKEILSYRVWQLSEKLEREIDERRQIIERESAKTSAVTGAAASNQDALDTEIEPVTDDIRSTNEQVGSMKSLVESIQNRVVGLGQLEKWVINEDLTRTHWSYRYDVKTSDKFQGVGRPYLYELASRNLLNRYQLRIHLRIWRGPRDSLLEWPFRGEVTVTVASTSNNQECCKRTQQCQIERPPYKSNNWSDVFRFDHSDLREAGLDISNGVSVSCWIVSGTGQ